MKQGADGEGDNRMALKKQLLIFFVAITALLLPFFLCSCDRKDIDPKDCYGKWVPKDGKSPSKCISLHKDGTVEFFDLNWNDVGATEGLHSMPRTGVWQLGSRYENAGGLLFMPAKAIDFSYGKGGFVFATGWFRWANDRLELLFLGGDPDNYVFMEYLKSEPGSE